VDIFGTALTIYYMSKTDYIRAAELIVQNNGRVTTRQTLEAYMPRFSARLHDLKNKCGLEIEGDYIHTRKDGEGMYSKSIDPHGYYSFKKEEVEVLREYLGVPTIKKGAQLSVFNLL